MYNKSIGFAVLALLALAACHNVFNKDKASTDSSFAQKIAPALTSIDSTPSTATTTPPAAKPPLDSNLRYVYLTFDDGPGNGTLNCYNVCRSKGVKATFFLVGEHAENHWGQSILSEMRKDMRHFLFANHSYTHANNRYISFYQHYRSAFEDFVRTQDSLRFDAPIARFPGNPAWVMDSHFRSSKLTRQLAKMMDSVGYNVMGWDIEWNFNKKAEPVQSAETMARQVEEAFATKSSFYKNHVVLLSHDRMFREPAYRDSLAKMIGILQQKKYVFETADQYPILKNPAKNLLAMRK